MQVVGKFDRIKSMGIMDDLSPNNLLSYFSNVRIPLFILNYEIVIP